MKINVLKIIFTYMFKIISLKKGYFKIYFYKNEFSRMNYFTSIFLYLDKISKIFSMNLLPIKPESHWSKLQNSLHFCLIKRYNRNNSCPRKFSPEACYCFENVWLWGEGKYAPKGFRFSSDFGCGKQRHSIFP